MHSLSYSDPVLLVCALIIVYIIFLTTVLAQPWESIRTMRNIFPAVGLGALTTVLSYIAIGFTPLVGLRQIVFFCFMSVL